MPLRIPVRVRILTAILVVTAIGLVGAGGVAYALQKARVMTAIDEELRQELAQVESSAGTSGVRSPAPAVTPTAGATPVPESAESSEPIAFADADDAIYELMRLVPSPIGGGTIGLVGGEPRYLPGEAADVDLHDAAFLAEVELASSGRILIASAELNGRELRYLAVPLIVSAGDEGMFISAISPDQRLADLRAVIAVYAWVAAGVLVLVALVGWFVAGRLLSPVRELRRTAARITAGALDERIPVAGNDDLSDLTETINAMIARLEDAFLGQRRILNDVRHELATPVTIVRGHLELIDAADPADVEQTRALVLDELDRMSGLIAQIARLADAERATEHHPVPEDIGALTREVFAKARVIPGPDWRLGTVPSGEATVDQAQLTQAWLQLADNAAKYAGEGTRVVIGSTLSGGVLSCSVADEGPGIPEEARERIFERFARVADGRGTTGSGLGLAIVRALVQAHGGRIDLDSEVGVGSRFTMRIPQGQVLRTDENDAAAQNEQKEER